MFKKTKLILRAFLMMAVIVLAASPSSAAEKPKPIKRIDTMLAVFDLEITEGVTKGISRPLSESIRREIVMSGRYEVIDRGNMNKILGEQKFQLSGCAAGECIVEAGQLLGVGKIVTGSIGLVGKTYYLSLSVINVETGKIENSSEDECKCEVDDLIKSSKRLVKKLMGEKVVEEFSVKEPSKKEFSLEESEKRAKEETKSWAKGKKVGVFADSGTLAFVGKTMVEGVVEGLLLRAGAEVRDTGAIDYRVVVLVQMSRENSYNSSYNSGTTGVIRVTIRVTDDKTKKLVSLGSSSSNVFASSQDDYEYAKESALNAAAYTAIYGSE